MEKYKDYLAEQILTGDEVITYRFLSRTLKVHVNVAKQMLFDFHKWQNEKQPGTIHATYLLYGVKKQEITNSQAQQDGDVEMSGSLHETESNPETVPTFVMSLVKEEDLKDSLEQYEDVSSIHIYSLAPHPLKDMVMLSDVARQVTALNLQGDASNSSAVYGTITNSGARRRERKGAGARLATAPHAAAVAEPLSGKTSKETKAKEEPSEPTRKATVTSAPAVKKPNAVPSLKRAGSSGIAQSFARAAALPKKAPKPNTSASKAAIDDDQHMSDDGEDDSEEQPKPDAAGTTEGERKSRKEREAELRRMMDEDDADDGAEVEAKESGAEEEEEAQEEDVPAPPAEKEEPAEEVASTSGDGRRRGRRRVMKKKQVMDDQGYLVTIQEAGWESFSEEEKPAVTASKAKPAISAAPSQANKPKKGGAKGSQGNIMSFFAKK